jgi:hypothetical protein
MQDLKENAMSASEENDGRLSFNQAIAYVKQTGKDAFTAMPVFGEDGDDEEARAEGARVFIISPDEEEGWTVRFVAGPFFSNAFAANDIIPYNEIPDHVRELRYIPTHCEDEWLEEQIQILIGKLTQAAGVGDQMPDYESQPIKVAGPDAVFPVHFLGRGEPH